MCRTRVVSVWVCIFLLLTGKARSRCKKKCEDYLGVFRSFQGRCWRNDFPLLTLGHRRYHFSVPFLRGGWTKFLTSFCWSFHLNFFSISFCFKSVFRKLPSTVTLHKVDCWVVSQITFNLWVSSPSKWMSLCWNVWTLCCQPLWAALPAGHGGLSAVGKMKRCAGTGSQRHGLSRGVLTSKGMWWVGTVSEGFC